ncbi:alpha/beta hydrolase [Methylobacterium aerolatum]|uniref:Acetyl esterase/lipase n=1 Tax=Methylobacterium aerolatum TaxID=418708 RepID=A0ABU0I1B1_9HYPH|nr:alpha/beta hydrolase [Methylobacterium aerolatum]MDQ0447464.1 acetyl esterase/lipase [Methylobacterium aerolatum]GJD37449.1 Monoterpene epsilon-lactone hydrolase [Methylobacterium aerolatum]
MASLRAYIGAWMVRRRVKAQLAAATSVEDVRRVLGGPSFPDPRDVRFEAGTVGGVPGEWIHPVSGRPERRLLYVHGGGFVACSPRTHRPLTGAVARRGFSVFAPDYRLAPEHPFPAGLEDVVAAWTAFRAEGPACLAGESAGGNLALALMLAARERGLPMPQAACLFSPVTDLAAEGGSRVRNARRDAMFGARSISEVAPLYTGAGDPRAPLASPVYGDPTGLPPLLFHVGDREVLLDDSVRMADRAQAAGVEASVRIFPVVAHAWQFADKVLPEATASLDEAAAFLKRHSASRSVPA